MGTGPFSVCLWNEPTPSGSINTWETVFVLTQSSSQGGNDIKRYGTNNYLEVHTTQETTETRKGTAAACSDPASNLFAANLWTHVCATVSTSALTVYQNL